MTEETEIAGGAETPLNPILPDADRMAALGGKMEEVMEEQDKEAGRNQSQGSVDLEASPQNLLEADVESIIGSDALEQLKIIFSQRSDQSLESQVSIESVDLPIGRIEILNNENNAPTYMVVYNTTGTNITLAFVQEYLNISPSDDRLTDEIGEPAFRYGEIVKDSLQAAGAFQKAAMGMAFDDVLESYISTYTAGAKRQQLGDLLLQVRALSSALGKVFAFDDYRHLEVFMAAWLMKDSTCRLSGVPGTGKTTVIECAATLLSNSYGFNTTMRLVAPKSYVADTVSQIYGENNSLDNIYTPTIFPTGQEYNIIYGNPSRPEIKDLWEDWRFQVWKSPKGTDGAYRYAGTDANNEPNQTVSGSYLYDFSFLQPSGTGVNSAKVAIQPDAYRKLLLQHYYVDVPETTIVSDTSTWPEFDKAGLAVIPSGVGKKRLVKPVKILNADGSFNEFAPQINLSSGEGEAAKTLTMKLAHSDMNSEIVRNLISNISDGLTRAGRGSFRENAEQFIAKSGLSGMWSDAGRNEGYWLRELLHSVCYDARATPGSVQWKALSAEMLGEIGIAKVDFEKRADEVLYGMEIRETQSFDPAKGANVNTFDFEPVPRPIVTQPVKFFNEANRSKPGMEDAILGLIAERKVEYRGKEFDSPNFVAWMDTNPHQKGNDLAFTDRIDMEILFKSVSMGGRYNIMANRAGVPVEQLIVNLTQSGAMAPLRFYQIRNIWSLISNDSEGISMVQGGGSYDGYRDVAAISVLFSQAYRTRQTDMPVGENQTYSWVENPHESPLVDFSTTTNTTSRQGKGGVDAAVLKKGTKAFAGGAETIGDTAFRGAGAAQVQLPAIFTRVLGFRFTNSIIKLAKAFAFLRGKTYVSRDDIVDAIPYTVAHRIGRSREGLTDTEGNTKGIESAVGMNMAYNSEQEFLREMLVRGYINRDINIGQGTGASLLEMLDSFYERCVSILQSSDYAHEYESEVLTVLQTQFTGENSLSDTLTPVHWHLATMVSESERSGNTILRNYGDNNTYGYPELYERFMQRITSPTRSEIVGDACLNDMFRLRYEIVNESNLFSDDKARLLSLCDEEISIYAAGLSNRGTAYYNNSVDDAAIGSIAKIGANPILHLPTYGDTMGAWGAVSGITSATNEGLSNRLSGLSFSGAQYGQDTAHQDISSQQIKLIGRIKDGLKQNDQGEPVLQSTDEYGRFHQSLRAFSNQMATRLLSEEGRFIANPNNQSGNIACSFNEFMDIVTTVTKLDEQNRSFTAARTYELGGSSQSINWAAGDSLRACFAVPHSQLSNFVSGSVTEMIQGVEIERPARGTTRDHNINMWENPENDFLRLWVSLRAVPASADNALDTKGFMTFIFTAAVTSNLGEYNPLETTPTTQTGRVTLLPMTDPRAYSSGTFSRSNSAIGDAGNITKADRQEYLAILGSALQPRTTR